MKKLQVLEGLRGLAAVYIFLTHFLILRVFSPKTPITFPFRFGPEAVILFFLLSGFVIYYSVYRRPESFRLYFLRRFRRIYPIYLLCLMVSILTHWGNIPVRELIGSVMMLQDYAGTKPGVWFDTFLGNAPLWSLAYEWWFYMMFYPLFYLVSSEKQKWVVAGLSFCGWLSFQLYPTPMGLYLSYFLIWWTGVEVARVYCRGEWPSFSNLRVPIFLLLGGICLQIIPVIKTHFIEHTELAAGIHPILELRHFASCGVILLVALALPRAAFPRLNRLLQPFVAIAPISYALYILHTPLAVQGAYLAFIPSASVRLLGYVLVTVAVSWFAEGAYQRLWNRWIRFLSDGARLTQESRL